VVTDDDGHVLGVVEAVTDISELNQARRKAQEASRKLGDIQRLDNIIGKSQAMSKVFSKIRLAASSDATVLVQEESSTGKELIAGAIRW
jgi:transcriptional regulator with PAS, ATPase and Fis domain